MCLEHRVKKKAQALDAVWTRTDFFDFGAVVIDYELKGRHRCGCFQSAVYHIELERGRCPGSCGDGIDWPLQARFRVGAWTMTHSAQ